MKTSGPSDGMTTLLLDDDGVAAVEGGLLRLTDAGMPLDDEGFLAPASLTELVGSKPPSADDVAAMLRLGEAGIPLEDDFLESAAVRFLLGPASANDDVVAAVVVDEEDRLSLGEAGMPPEGSASREGLSVPGAAAGSESASVTADDTRIRERSSAMYEAVMRLCVAGLHQRVCAAAGRRPSIKMSFCPRRTNSSSCSLCPDSCPRLPTDSQYKMRLSPARPSPLLSALSVAALDSPLSVCSFHWSPCSSKSPASDTCPSSRMLSHDST